jgi:uncharacterized protein YjbI with pentapeptide repeats
MRPSCTHGDPSARVGTGECRLGRREYYGAILSGADLSGADLGGSHLMQAHLAKARLIKANLRGRSSMAYL